MERNHAIIKYTGPRIKIKTKLTLNSRFIITEMSKCRIHEELACVLLVFWNSIKLDEDLRWEIRGDYKFRKKTIRFIHRIKNLSNRIYIYREIKERS